MIRQLIDIINDYRAPGADWEIAYDEHHQAARIVRKTDTQGGPLLHVKELLPFAEVLIHASAVHATKESAAVTNSVPSLATELLRAVEEDASLRLNMAFGEAAKSEDKFAISDTRDAFINVLREFQKVPE